jgi:hypothetical protein
MDAWQASGVPCASTFSRLRGGARAESFGSDVFSQQGRRHLEVAAAPLRFLDESFAATLQRDCIVVAATRDSFVRRAPACSPRERSVVP